MESKAINCKNCGAPVTSEICPYCGSLTGLVTATANMDYPVLECKETNINFWNVVFPAVFFLTFGVLGIIIPLTFYKTSQSMTDNFKSVSGFDGFMSFDFASPVLFMCIPFLLIGLAAFVIMIKPIIRYIILKTRGKQIQGTVYGYVNDNVLLNGSPAQTVKILVQSPEGPRFIMYQLGRTDHPYGINSKIDLYVYNNYFMIDKSKEKIKW